MAKNRRFSIIGYSSGSYPEQPEKGWQTSSLFNPLNPPFKNPYFKIACFVYSEQLGSKRQLAGKIFPRYRWYISRSQILGFENIKRRAFCGPYACGGR